MKSTIPVALAAAVLALAACSDDPVSGNASTSEECPSEDALREATGEEEFDPPDRAVGRVAVAHVVDGRDVIFEGIACWYRLGGDAYDHRHTLIFFHEAGTTLESVTSVLGADEEIDVDGADEAYTDGEQYVVVTVDERLISTSHTTTLSVAHAMAQVALGTA